METPKNSRANSIIYDSGLTRRPGGPTGYGGKPSHASFDNTKEPITIGEIMEREVLKFSTTDSSSRLREAWPGQPVIVIDEEQFYNSEIILDAYPVDSFLESDRSFSELLELMVTPMFTTANVPIVDLYQSMLFDRGIRGFLVYEKKNEYSFQVNGVASALDIFRVILGIDRSIKFRVQSGSPPPPVIRIPPHTDCPDNLCYLCVDENKLYPCWDIDRDNITYQPYCRISKNHSLRQHSCTQ